MEIPKSFLGYKRENGRAGTRNHVIILPVDDISNACAEAVANNIKGTMALPHSYGRLQFGADLDLHFRTMIGTGSNPNVAAVIVIGIEPKWTKKIVDGIAKTGKPVEGFHIERTGDIGTVMKASKKAQEFVMWASEKQREECPMSDLWISVKCGESDTTSGLAANPTVGNLMDKLEPMGVHLCFGETSELTGAETVCAKRGATPEASEKFMKTWNSYNDFILKEATDDLSESQPTAGNIAGGLTTIEEKAFGNFQKIGSCKFIDVLEPAEEPTKGKGLYFMDTSSAAAECVTLQAAAGFNIHLFPTGQGNIVGNPIEPVVKLTANPLTVKGMGEHIDCDVSKILSREMTMSEAGDELIKSMIRVANGRLTCAEALGHKEFVMTKALQKCLKTHLFKLMLFKKYLVIVPGIILAFVLYTLSQGFNNIIGIELLGYTKSPISTAMIAILIGIILGNIFLETKGFLIGIDFTQKYILKIGIICLGIQLKPFEFLKFGTIAIPLIIVCIISVLIVVKLLIKRLKISTRMAYLISIGSTVCGTTAIMATAPIIEQTKVRSRMQ